MKVTCGKPKPATKKQIETARRKLRRRLFKQRDDITIGTYNLVAPGVVFKPGNYYHAQWFVDGVERHSNIFRLPDFGCENISSEEWMTTYIETVLLAFNLSHVDVIVNEVKNDCEKM